MSIFEPAPPPWPARMLAVLRIVAGALFVMFGTVAMLHWPPASVAIPPFNLMTQMGIGAALEVLGGLLIVLGLLTRPVAFILAGEMAVAYFQFHAPMSIYPTVNNGTPAILYCFLYLYLMIAGPGAWSVDGIIASRRGRA